MTDESQLKTLITRVQANKKYRSIHQSLVRHLSQEALSKGLAGKPAVKAVRNKLHQVGGAYFKQNLDYDEVNTALTQLTTDLHAQQTRAFCLKTMKAHASTAERLPILADFFQTCLAPIAPVTSVLDLACGLNPLAIPWMPLAEEFRYRACDIYLDMLGLIERFFKHFDLDADAQPCDLLGAIPKWHGQVTLLLKALPCLEQVDKAVGPRLLDAIQSEHILVSYPVQSLSGTLKGMPNFYHDHFKAIVSGKNWGIREFRFKTELAFLVTK
jgi:16S rRNA (guanine(1405)-N(7))-methyltransferase